MPPEIRPELYVAVGGVEEPLDIAPGPDGVSAIDLARVVEIARKLQEANGASGTPQIIMRPGEPDTDGVQRFADNRIEVDVRQRQLRIDGQPTHTGRYVFNLLTLLSEEPDSVYSKRLIMDYLWPRHPNAYDSLRLCVHRARVTMGELGPKALRTHKHGGYMVRSTLATEE
jgi:DNA-binding response OmpR family regulator